MIISLIFAWIATICVVLTGFKIYAKKNKTCNKIFHKIHIPVGIIMIVAGLIHGLLAGNRYATSLGDLNIGGMLFSLNAGSLCMLLSILLALSYLLRKVLKKNWMGIHRVLTLMLVLTLAFHIGQVGITLPDVVSETFSQTAEADGDDTGAEGNGGSGSDTESADDGESGADTEVTEGNESGSDTEVTEENESGSDTDKDGAGSGETGSAAEESEENNSDSETIDSSQITFSGAELKDGTYEGSAEGYKSTITVSVTVASGKVTNIEVVEENDTPDFFERAKNIIDTVLNQQSMDVDTVSGATYSSRGILQAVADALEPAVISGELAISESGSEQNSGTGGHGHHGDFGQSFGGSQGSGL